MKPIIYFLIPFTSQAAITDCKTCGLMTWGSMLLGYLTVAGIVAIVLMAIFMVTKRLVHKFHDHSAHNMR